MIILPERSLPLKMQCWIAEGAIETAMREYPGTLNKARCLVAGFGRVGKALSLALRGLNAEVTASARNGVDLAWIEVFGCRAIHTDEIFTHGQYGNCFLTRSRQWCFPEKCLRRRSRVQFN